MTSSNQLKTWYKKFAKENNPDRHLGMSPSQSKFSKSSRSNFNKEEESSEWWVWYTNQPNGVFFGWGHAGICYECAVEIFKKSGIWHFCRKGVYLVLKIELRTIFDNYVLVKAATFAKDSNIRFEDDVFSDDDVVIHNNQEENKEELKVPSKESSKRDKYEEETKTIKFKMNISEESKSIRPSKRMELNTNSQLQSPYISSRHNQGLVKNSLALSNRQYSNRLFSLRKQAPHKFEEITDEELAAHGLDYISNEFGSEMRVRLSESNHNTFRKKNLLVESKESKVSINHN